MAFLVGGFALINKFGVYYSFWYVSSEIAFVVVLIYDLFFDSATVTSCWTTFFFYLDLAPDATQFGEHTITQKHLYTGLFVIGIPLLWYASPISTIFWIFGASAVLILGHACLMEPGVESDYAAIDGETV